MIKYGGRTSYMAGIKILEPFFWSTKSYRPSARGNSYTNGDKIKNKL